MSNISVCPDMITEEVRKLRQKFYSWKSVPEVSDLCPAHQTRSSWGNHLYRRVTERERPTFSPAFKYLHKKLCVRRGSEVTAAKRGNPNSAQKNDLCGATSCENLTDMMTQCAESSCMTNFPKRFLFIQKEIRQ